MNLLVLGHSVIDHIHKDDELEIKPGGIFYTITGLYHLINAEDKISLVTAIDTSSYSLFQDIYDKIDLSYSKTVKAIPTVNLTICEYKERDEQYKNFTDDLNFETMKELNSFNGILINMITGFELSLQKLKEIRKIFNKPIFIDIHSLSKGIDDNNKRFLRKIPNAVEWIKNVDFIQVNEYELKTLSDYEIEDEAAKYILKLGPAVLIITKSEKGFTAYIKEKNEINKFEKKALKINSINKVGCGDIFGATFFYQYLKSGNIRNSLQVANNIAALTTTLKNFDEYKKIKEYVNL
ncbi:MAG: carbohydrate kinase family protein [Ignavibacteriales bacterium]|nr:carbohydrate kinase family protein [Ignavibacteriales bacterium]